jgi:hypothetical protein
VSSAYALNEYLEFRRDLLGFVRDVEFRHRHILLIGFHESSEHPNESGFTGTILSQQHDDLTVREVTCLHVQLEVAYIIKSIQRISKCVYQEFWSCQDRRSCSAS